MTVSEQEVLQKDLVNMVQGTGHGVDAEQATGILVCRRQYANYRCDQLFAQVKTALEQLVKAGLLVTAKEHYAKEGLVTRDDARYFGVGHIVGLYNLLSASMLASRPPDYAIRIRFELNEGYSAQDAELDDETLLGCHWFHGRANSLKQAEELALDRFHELVAIGNLEAVTISAEAMVIPAISS